MIKNNENGVFISKVKHGTNLYYVCGVLISLLAIVVVLSAINAIIIVVSYICGLVICYLALKYKETFIKHIIILLHYFGYHLQYEENQTSDSPKVNCTVCGNPSCIRHSYNSSSNPWENLMIHKQLDQSIEDFYSIILNEFVTGWYSKLTNEQSLLVELRFLLRYSSSSLLKRALKVDIGNLITSKLIPCALNHYAVCVEAQRDLMDKGCKDIQEAAINGPLRYSLHPAVTNRESELVYLRSVTKAIMPFLLPKEETDSKLFKILIREIFSGWVLLSLTDVLSDPDILNTLAILATGNEKMAKLPELPKHQVEFLENFVKNDDYKRLRLLTLDVTEVLKNPEYLYAFMQYMKSVRRVHLLQFCLDIDDFHKRMLQPDLSTNEQIALFNSAWDIYLMYFAEESSSYISFSKDVTKQFKDVLDEGTSSVLKLQTSKALFQAYDHVFTELDKTWAPKFFDNEEFYKLLIGPRPSKDFHTSNVNRKMDKGNPSKMGNQLSKFKVSLKPETVDGQMLESSDNMARIVDTDFMDSSDVDSQFSDILADYARLKERDLSTWRVSIEDVKEKRMNNKSGVLHLFTISVLRTDPLGLGNENRWTVDRTDADFYMLKTKLVEFHGEVEMGDANVPSKKQKAAVEVRKMKYEVFLQNLLLKPLLKSSDLLHLFLTEEDDFSSIAEQARPGFSIVPDLGNIYQTVTHKLRKERGQNLISFMNTFLVSTDVDYYQSLKEVDHGEEATDISSNISNAVFENNIGRNIIDDVFGNNFGIADAPCISVKRKQFKVTGFTQTLQFLLSEVFKVRQTVIGISGTMCYLGGSKMDGIFDKLLNKALYDILPPPRLAHLIKLGQAVLFENMPTRKMTSEERRSLAKTQLQNAFPFLLVSTLGPNFLKGVDDLFEFVQNPLLNKQLIYNLLDIILAELFPELESDAM